MAIRDDKIAYVGPEAGVEKYRGEKTKTIALEPGQMVLPGFHDCHVHLMDGAMVQLQCQLDTAKSREETLEMIKAYVKANPAAPWILGFGWQPPFFPEGGPNKADLDAIEPTRPVLLFSQDGHSSWANSAALKLGGIDKTTKDPERGRIERDPATGEPSGALREAASEPIDKLAPAPRTTNGSRPTSAHRNSQTASASHPSRKPSSRRACSRCITRWQRQSS